MWIAGYSTVPTVKVVAFSVVLLAGLLALTGMLLVTRVTHISTWKRQTVVLTILPVQAILLGYATALLLDPRGSADGLTGAGLVLAIVGLLVTTGCVKRIPARLELKD
jgi:hypothetical protein